MFELMAWIVGIAAVSSIIFFFLMMFDKMFNPGIVLGIVAVLALIVKGMTSTPSESPLPAYANERPTENARATGKGSVDVNLTKFRKSGDHLSVGCEEIRGKVECRSTGYTPAR